MKLYHEPRRIPDFTVNTLKLPYYGIISHGSHKNSTASTACFLSWFLVKSYTNIYCIIL